MEKKFLSLVLFFLLVALFPSFVNAQIPISTNSGSSLKGQRVERKQQIKDTVQMKRDEFKARIQTIKDQRKKLLVERIDTKIAELNKKSTDKFSEVLARLQTHLDKISQSTKDEKVLADIKTAQAAIDTAVAAVASQSAKVYTIQITTEQNLRINVGTTMSQFRQDLMATHKLVVNAKQAVQALNKDRVIMKKEATNSANL